MKKTLSLIFTVLFLAVCLVPGLGLLLTGGADAAANEILPAAPVIAADGTSIRFSRGNGGLCEWPVFLPARGHHRMGKAQRCALPYVHGGERLARTGRLAFLRADDP